MTHSRTFKATILSSGEFLVTLTALISAAVLSRLFTKEDYAAYRQTLLAYAFVAPLLALGLPQALYYFVPRDRENSRSILTGNLLLLFLMGGVFTVAMWCRGNELLARRFSNPAISQLLLIYSPYALLALPVSAVGACLMSCDRVKTLAIYHVASRLLTVLCIIGLVLIWRTPQASIGATVLAELLIFFPAIVLMYRATKGTIWLDKNNLWDQIKYSVPLGAASTIGIISKNLDKVIVSSMCPPEEFAVYANGAIEIPLIGILTGSVTAVLMPDIVKFYKEGNKAAALEMWKRAALKCAMILLPAMCFLFVMAPEVMRVLFSAKYTESAGPFRIYLLLLPVRIVTWGAMLLAAGKSSWILSRTAIMLILNIILSIIFVKYMGFIGAALSNVAVSYFWLVPYNSFAISKLYGFPLRKILPYKQLFKIMTITIFAALICMIKRILFPLSDFVKLVVLAAAYGVSVTMLMLRFDLLNKTTVIATLRSCRQHLFGNTFDSLNT